ncbi:hypothetical protein ACKVWC_008200 [Pyricularia oryzae]
MPGRFSISKVVLVGKGYVGGYVYAALVDAGFQVTVLSRSNPKGDHHVKIVDYSSTESIRRAIQDHDAVVCTISHTAWEHQYRLIDAAVEAGTVKHFIPSDFTALSCNAAVHHLPYYREAAAMQNYLAQKADGAGMRWNVIQSGPIIGCVLNGSYAYDFRERTALLVGDRSIREHRVSMSRGVTVGRAIAAILGRGGDLKKNGPVYIGDVVTTQGEILRLAEEKSGAEWRVREVDPEAKLKEALSMSEVAAAEGKPTPMFATFLVIHNTIFGAKYRTAWDGRDVEELGIPTLTREEWGRMVATRVCNEPVDGGLPWNSSSKPRD